MNQKLTTRFVVIFGVLVLFLLMIFPPGRVLDSSIAWKDKHTLKPGLDISGGSALLYEIQVPNGGRADADLSQRMADSLKKRVDPGGLKNLAWRAQGPTRLEIEMPLSAEDQVRGTIRTGFLKAQKALEATNLRAGQVDAVISGPREQRKEAIGDLAQGYPRRLELLTQAAAWYDKLEAAKAAKSVTGQVDAEDKLKELRAELEQTNLAVSEIQPLLDSFQASIDDALRKKDQGAVTRLLAERNRKVDDRIKGFTAFPARKAAVLALRDAFDKYAPVKGKLDDTEDLKRLLKGSGMLEFRILPQYDPANPSADIEAAIVRLTERGPALLPGDNYKWVMVDRPEEFRRPTVSFAGKHYALAYNTPDRMMVHKSGAKEWGLMRAYKDANQSGIFVVGFEFDTHGGTLFGDLTGANINQPLAVILDDRVVSAPNINSRIEGRGIIEGGEKGFSDQELKYLISTLNAGSLPATLTSEPISERTVGPQLGHDNLVKGLVAGTIGFLTTAAFMVGYYYYAGLIATFAMVMNLVITLGVMAMFNATFTLPGIAGIILTTGMAVDANVLIFERLREEQHRGLSLKQALRNAQERAFSAIFDSNLTTIMTSLVLYWLGSEEIKGFGLTLAIGVASSMFTALYVTRAVFDLGQERFGLKHLGSLPLSFPKLDKSFRPDIDWMRLAPVFITSSAIFIIVGLTAYFSMGREIYDIEFVPGTAVHFELRPEKKLTLQEVRSRVDQVKFQGTLKAPQVVAVGTEGLEFELRTPNDDASSVRRSIIEALGENLKVDLPSKFLGVAATFDDARTQKAVVPIGGDKFMIDGWEPSQWRVHNGGVAIVLRQLDPPLSKLEVDARISRARLQADRIGMPFREFVVETPVAADKPSDRAVLMLSDAGMAYDKAPDQWESELARPWWDITTEAINRPPQLQKVTVFSPQMAREAVIDALLAVAVSVVFMLIFLWFRFGNVLYGSAAALSLFHDVLVVLGLVGISYYVAHTAVGRALLVEPFRMNLTVLAGILTVIGYSVNDTIVVFDRIRENRGRFGHVNRKIINDSINQTLSRTMLTGLTTIVTLSVMYILGGAGVHAFTYILLFGIISGTYSSIAIAVPLLLLIPRKDEVDHEVETKPAPLPHAG